MSSIATVTVSVRARVSRRAAPPRGASTRAAALSSVARAPVALRGSAAFRPARQSRSVRVVANAAPPAGDALPPPATFNAVCAAAEKKATQDPTTTLVLGFSAGALIGIGALLMSCIGAASPALAAANPGLCNFLKGAVGLPAGLTLVILTGAELFTGNVMVMLSGVLTKKIELAALIKNWVLSYAGNFVGSVVMAYLAFGAATAAAPAAKAAVIGIATTKASLPFGVAFFKGVPVQLARVSRGLGHDGVHLRSPAKILAIFWPISTFVALGFEHSIANMFLIPHGMLCGAQVSVADMMLNNIIPRHAGQRLRRRGLRRGAPLLRVRPQVRRGERRAPSSVLF
jgi:formate/nitrite transporter